MTRFETVRNVEKASAKLYAYVFKKKHTHTRARICSTTEAFRFSAALRGYRWKRDLFVLTRLIVLCKNESKSQLIYFFGFILPPALLPTQAFARRKACFSCVKTHRICGAVCAKNSRCNWHFLPSAFGVFSVFGDDALR